MDKNKNNKLLFTVFFVGSIVYLVKDIILYEYKYWQCNKAQQLFISEMIEANPQYKNYTDQRGMLECLNIINGVKH